MAATSGAIRAGKAFVEIYGDDSKLQQTLGQIQGRLRRFGNTVAAVGTKLLALGTAGASAFGIAIKAASDLQETMSKFDTVFGDASAAAKAWSDDFAQQVGRSKREIAGFLASAQDLFVPLGFDPTKAEALSKTITGLAVDLASFNNKTDADAMNDLQAALTGSGEVMKKYGVILNEAAVKQELFNMGLDPKNASETEKVMARLNIILAGTTAAQGDAIRTADSFANQAKRLKGELEDAAATIGTALLPVVTPLVTKAADAGRAFGKWASENKETVVQVAKLVGGLVAVGGSLVAFGVAVNAVASAVGGLSVAMKLAAGNAGLLGAALGAFSLAIVVIELLKATEGMREFNAEMERAKRLQSEIGIKRDAREQATIDKATSIADPEQRRAFVQSQIDLEKGNLAAAQGNVQTSQRQLESATSNAYKSAVDALGLNTDADIARRQLAEAEDKARSIKDHIATLEKLLADSAESAPDAPSLAGDAPAAPGGIGAGLGVFDKTAWEQALEQVQADFSTKLGAATDLGSIDSVRLDSVGTFSNQADRALGGGDSRQVQLLEAIQRGIERVAVNTDDQQF